MLDLSRIRAVCFDVDGTLADTDDHLVQQLAALLDRLPLVSGRRAEQLARRLVMGMETPTNALYGALDRAGLDDELQAVRDRLRQIRRLRDPAHTRNPEAADEVPHEMIAGVREMVEKLAGRFPMSTISTGREGRVDRFLRHYEVRHHFAAVVGAETTPRPAPPRRPGDGRAAGKLPDGGRHDRRHPHRPGRRGADRRRAVRVRDGGRAGKSRRHGDPRHDVRRARPAHARGRRPGGLGRARAGR
jgi:phosphoglycolate phosphatase-like HAD superfamily hydrolase